MCSCFYINPATIWIVFSRCVSLCGKVSKRSRSGSTASFDNAVRAATRGGRSLSMSIG